VTSLRDVLLEPIAAFIRRVDEFDEAWEPFLTDEPDQDPAPMTFGPTGRVEPAASSAPSSHLRPPALGATAMKTIDAVRRSGIAVGPERSVSDAAKLMDQAGVGALAVIDGDALVGIVTDRDLVRRALARGLDLEARIDGVMTSPVVTIDADADLHDAFAILRANAVRRLAIVDGDRFVGMLSIDDLLMDLAADLGDLARPVTAEVVFGHHDSPVPAPAN
jgi:CBS domain-containing protein